MLRIGRFFGSVQEKKKKIHENAPVHNFFLISQRDESIAKVGSFRRLNLVIRKSKVVYFVVQVRPIVSCVLFRIARGIQATYLLCSLNRTLCIT
jgi:hypothetical protein